MDTGIDTSAWSAQQLAEFIAAVSTARTETAAARTAVERAAEALDADVAAIVCGGELVAAVGYPEGREPVTELEAVRPGAAEARLEVPGAGSCAAAAAALEYPSGATLVLARSEPDGLSREETGLLRGMARVTAITMRMLSVLDDERSAREALRAVADEQAALRRVAVLVAKAASPDEVFSAVAGEVALLAGADVAVVLRYERDGTATVVGGWGDTGGNLTTGKRLTVAGEGAAVSVFRTGRPTGTVRFTGPPGSVAAAFGSVGVQSGSGSPIVVEGRLWGAVIAARTRPEPLPPAAELHIPAFTELAATAIANAQARTELRALADEQAALRRVATLVARAAPPEAVFTAVTAEAGRLLGADHTGMCRYEPDGVVAAVGAWTSTDAAAPIPAGTRWRLGGQNVTTMVFETGRPARIENYASASGPAADIARGEGLRSAIGVPIRVEDRLWGVVIVSSTRKEAPSADTEGRLAGFIELVAIAIANAESQAALSASRARIVATADATRRRIERDLHDGAQQRLVTLALQLRAAQAAAPPEARELAKRVDDVAAGLTGVLGELREIARGIHPAILAEGGLRPALKALSRRCAVPVRVDVQVAGRLPEQIEIAAYYAVSEALTNTAKHAHAAVAEVEVAAGDGLLRICVRDDGRGGAVFDRGSGLVGLQDRVEALGGRLSLHSPPGAGTTVEIALPFGHPGTPAWRAKQA